MYLPDSIRVDIIKHALALAPNQACGLVLFDDRMCAVKVEHGNNLGAWPYGFQIDPASQRRAYQQARQNGWSVSGVYHSHAVSSAVPTGRDLKRPVPKGMLYLIVSLLDQNKPELCGYLIEQGVPTEVSLDRRE